MKWFFATLLLLAAPFVQADEACSKAEKIAIEKAVSSCGGKTIEIYKISECEWRSGQVAERKVTFACVSVEPGPKKKTSQEEAACAADSAKRCSSEFNSDCLSKHRSVLAPQCYRALGLNGPNAQIPETLEAHPGRSVRVVR